MYHKNTESAPASWREKASSLLEQETESLIAWLSVLYGLGIAIYFALSTEPPLWVCIILVLTLILYGITLKTKSLWARRIAIGLVFLSLGFTGVKVRTDVLATPQLQSPIGIQAFEGRVNAIERMVNSTRITIDHVQFEKKLNPDKPIPHKIRITLKGRLQPSDTLMPGDLVRGKAFLNPPMRPVLPGGYDFRRKAYFEGIGAVGYGIKALTALAPLQDKGFFRTLSETVAALRTRLTAYMRAQIPGESGAIVAALVTGDRAGITDTTRQAYADAGIAHILAISGLHLSIVAGLIFFVIRNSLALIPGLALRQPVKKWAAAIALLFTFVYLVVCGASIPAERAFVMTSLVLIAVMLDRTALTMRNVALAALVVLFIIPEALVSVSFQLSFAAVIALVASYERMHSILTRWRATCKDSRVKKYALYLFGLMFSSFIATLATSPFTIFTFNRFSLVAILTNLLAIPYVSLVLMPLIVFFLFTAPFLGTLIAPLVGQAIDFLSAVAFYFQKLPGAIILVPHASLWVQMLCVSGLLWLALWTTSLRLWGLVPLALSGFLFYMQKAPDLFIAEGQQILILRDSQGKPWVNSLQAGRFARKAWLQQSALEHIEKITADTKPDNFQVLGEGHYRLTKGATTLDFHHSCIKGRFEKVCTLTVEVPGEGYPLLAPTDFKTKGGHSLWLDPTHKSCTWQSVAQCSGKRPWS
jgi:competence protein ComEC